MLSLLFPYNIKEESWRILGLKLCGSEAGKWGQILSAWMAWNTRGNSKTLRREGSRQEWVLSSALLQEQPDVSSGGHQAEPGTPGCGGSHLPQQERWWQWRGHAAWDEPLQLTERMSTIRTRDEALVRDGSPKIQCYAKWLNRGQRSFSKHNTRRWMVLRRGALQWGRDSYLWVGGTSQTRRSNTKGRASCPCRMSWIPTKQCGLALLPSSRSQSLARETDLQTMLEP